MTALASGKQKGSCRVHQNPALHHEPVGVPDLRCDDRHAGPSPDHRCHRLHACAGGADADAADARGATALMLAACNGHLEVVRCLAGDRGADADAAVPISVQNLLFFWRKDF